MNLKQFNKYLEQIEPSKQKIANNWKIAIGFQAVDNLQVSEFLLNIAKQNIDGEITIDEAIAAIEDHYR